MGFFKNIINNILQASKPSFVFENNELRFHLHNDKTYTYDLGTYDLKTRHDPYAMEAYTIKNSDIHLEFIHRDHTSEWNGFSRGYYESLLKEELKLKSLEALKREEFGQFEFTTYKVNDNFIIHFIFIWSTHRDIFIIDTKGELFKKLLTLSKKDYTYEYDNEEKGNINFDISLVKKNAFNAYFNQSSGN